MSRYNTRLLRDGTTERDDPKYLAAQLNDGSPYERAISGVPASSVDGWTDLAGRLTAERDALQARLKDLIEAADALLEGAALNEDEKLLEAKFRAALSRAKGE